MSKDTGLGGTVARECHGCVERDHEIERLRKVVDMVVGGEDEREERLVRAVAAMIVDGRRSGVLFGKGKEDEAYARRLQGVGLAALRGPSS